MIDNMDKLHGDTFNEAYRIGEDLCEDGQVFITKRVKDRLANVENFENSVYEKVPDKENEIFSI